MGVFLGGHFSRATQEAIIEQAANVDVDARYFSQSLVSCTLFLSRFPLIIANILSHRTTPEPQVLQDNSSPAAAREDNHRAYMQDLAGSRAVPGIASLPNAWPHLQFLHLAQELRQTVRTLKAVPFCIRSSYGRIQTQALARIQTTHAHNPCHRSMTES